MHELDGENVITDAYMEEIRGQLGSTPRNLWNRFTKVLGWPMSEVERFNRASLALAAFRAGARRTDEAPRPGEVWRPREGQL